jgi:hypothetical protein
LTYTENYVHIYHILVWISANSFENEQLFLIALHKKRATELFATHDVLVRIDPPHSLVCRKRRLSGDRPLDKTGKTEAPCHSRCGKIKIPYCSKALGAEIGLDFE